jgi:hypothetical protein
MKQFFLKTRFLKIREKKILNEFINKNYKKNHIIVKSSKVLNFFFLNKIKKRFNFVGSFLNNKLVSIYGVLNNKHWDQKLKSDMQLSLWINKKNNSVSGFETIKYILNNLKPHSLFSGGLNPKTAGRLFSIFGKVVNYDHFYICNPIIKKVASRNLKYSFSKLNKTENRFVIIRSVKPLMIPSYDYFPKKSLKFFLNKYTKNPFYNYYFLNFKLNNKINFFFVCREIFVKKLKTKILRVVDFYGNLPVDISIKSIITNYLIKNDFEYMDFIVYGIDKKKMNKTGFNIKNKNQFIPNYFEPFLNRDFDLTLAIIVNPYDDKLVSVKGDADQEIPRKIK